MINKIESKLNELEYSHIINNSGRVHEYVKAHLVIMADDFGCIGVPEVRIPVAGKRSGEGRIDVVWYKSGVEVAGFEIEPTYKVNSIEKLIQLPKQAHRVIVSIHPDEKYINERITDLPSNIVPIKAGVG